MIVSLNSHERIVEVKATHLSEDPSAHAIAQGATVLARRLKEGYEECVDSRHPINHSPTHSCIRSKEHGFLTLAIFPCSWERSTIDEGWHRGVVTKLKESKKRGMVAYIKFDDEPKETYQIPLQVRWVKTGKMLEFQSMATGEDGGSGGDKAAEVEGGRERQMRVRDERWKMMERSALADSKNDSLYTVVPLVLSVTDPRLPMHEMMPPPVRTPLGEHVHTPVAREHDGKQLYNFSTFDARVVLHLMCI